MNEARSHRVYVKQFWSDDWQQVTNLFAERVVFCCSPEMPEATLYWNYGRVKPYSLNGFVALSKLDVLDYFVKIEIDQPNDAVREWHGIIKRESQIRRGARGINEDSGQQFMTAYGLEWLLDRKQLTSSWTLAFDLTDQEIQRCIGFNVSENGSRLVGNMAPLGGAKGAIFCDRPDNAERWTAYAIVDYLLSYHNPTDENGVVRVPFYLDPNYAEQLRSLDWWKVQLSYEGRTVKELLDTLMHRNRLMSYTVAVVNNEVLLQPFTFTEAQILLPSGAGNRIRANSSLATLSYDDEARVKGFVLNRDIQATYDQVKVRGERVGVVWTMQSEATMEADWDSDLQTDYNAGSTAAAATPIDYIKAILHRSYRNTDKFARVYRNFRIPAGWDGTSATGEPVIINPAVVSATVVTDPARFWQHGLRFEPYLPLRHDIDYETVTTVENIDDLTADNRHPEFRRMFGVHFVSGTERAYFLHKPESAQYYAAYAPQGQREWACAIRPQEETLGVIIDVSGAPQHVVARTEFTPADGADTDDWEAELDWRNFYITAYMLLDSFAQAVWPAAPVGLGTDALRSLVIDVQGKRQIWLVPDTIIDVNQDGTLKKSDGGWIENDGKELEDLARLTYDWYSRERRAIDLQLHTLDADVSVGELVTSVGIGNTLVQTNSVVTRMEFDLRDNSHSIYTQYAELDMRGL